MPLSLLIFTAKYLWEWWGAFIQIPTLWKNVQINMLFNFESLNFHSFDCYFTFLQYVNKYLKPETTSLKRIVNHNITHLFLWEMRTVVRWGAMERKEAKCWGYGRQGVKGRGGGWLAGVAAAVSSLACAPAPCGLFPASSCGASRPQHPPPLGLSWTGLLAAKFSLGRLPTPRLTATHTYFHCPLSG